MQRSRHLNRCPSDRRLLSGPAWPGHWCCNLRCFLPFQPPAKGILARAQKDVLGAYRPSSSKMNFVCYICTEKVCAFALELPKRTLCTPLVVNCCNFRAGAASVYFVYCNCTGHLGLSSWSCQRAAILTDTRVQGYRACPRFFQPNWAEQITL